MRMTRRKRRAYYRLSPRRLAECERRRTTINGRAESDACDIENVGKDKALAPGIAARTGG